MEKIASFCVDHRVLEAGLYRSRQDRRDGLCVTTFDLRFTAPNREPPLGQGALHTVEHLGATFLRNGARRDEVVYFGPMGCRTGFYLVMFGDLAPRDVLPLVLDMCDFIAGYEGEIPGARPEECGNYSEQDLPAARRACARYASDLRRYGRLEYPAFL